MDPVTAILLVIFIADLGASQQLLQQLWLGPSFWSLGCAGGFGVRALGQRLRDR